MTELDNSKSDHGSMDFDPEIELGDIMGDDDGDNDGQQVTDNPTGEGDVQKDHHSDGDEEKEKEKEEEGGGEWDTTSPDTIDKLSQFDIDDDKMARAKPKVQKPSTNGDVPPVSETTQKTETKAIIPQPPDSSPTPLAKKPADDEEEKIADEEPDNLDDNHKGDDDPQSEGERGDEDEGQQDNVDGDEPVPQAEIRTQESTSEGKPRRKGIFVVVIIIVITLICI